MWRVFLPQLDGEYKTNDVISLDDVWGVVDLLIKEVHESNGEFDADKSLIAQLPHFTCPNLFYDKDISRALERYSYCTENNVPPYPGTYGEQPYRWVQSFFTIKNAYAKRESMMLDKAKVKTKNGK